MSNAIIPYSVVPRLHIPRGHTHLEPALEAATAVILAGGKSTRMGCDKALLPLRGRPMIQHVADALRPHFGEVLISANDAEKFSFLGFRVIRDEVPGLGPLMAIVSALGASSSDLNLVVGCDMPLIDSAFARQMILEADGYDCVVPVTVEGHFEPLLAVYRKSVLNVAQTALATGRRRIACVFDRCRVKYVPLPEGPCARNVNTIEEYATVLSTESSAVARGAVIFPPALPSLTSRRWSRP